jgi:predicted dehydrogenase
MAFLGHLEPVAVYARKLGNYDWVVADELRVIMESENGIATVTSSCNSPIDVIVLVFFGTKMNLVIEISDSILFTYPSSRLSRPISEDFRRAFQHVSNGVWRTFNWISRRYYSGHYTLIRRFTESIQNATESPVTMEEGREVIRVYEKIAAQIDSTRRI